MSKLTDILDQFQHEQEIKSRCTVAQFADELGKDVTLVLEQFAEAGVTFSGPDDVVLPVHRERLLDWLKSKHSANPERKKISIRKNLEYSPYRSDWSAVAAGENGAEWDCLNRFAGEVIFGQKIHPEQQRLINLIVAKSVIQNALPMKRVGRPSESRTDELAMEVSIAYWELLDAGHSSSEVVYCLSSKFHKTERQIFRYVQAKRGFFKDTKEERDQDRQLFRMIASLRDPRKDDPVSRYEVPMPDLSSLSSDDYLDHLDELIAKEAGGFPDVKDLEFIDSDMKK